MTENQSTRLLPMSERDRQLLLEFTQLYQSLDREDRAEIRGEMSVICTNIKCTLQSPKYHQDKIKLYESMNPQGQQHLMEFARYMTSRPKYKKGIIPLPVGMGTEYGGQQGTSQLSSCSVHVHSITEIVSGK